MEHVSVNVALEVVNGAVLVVLAALAICLMAYIRMLAVMLKLTLREFFFDPPLGVRLARPMLTLKAGAVLSLGMAWGWRAFGGGQFMPAWMMTCLLAGIAILVVGALWLIRVLTCMRFGEWPWLTTIGVTGLFIAGSIAGHHLAGR
jgi:hypothetical protein